MKQKAVFRLNRKCGRAALLALVAAAVATAGSNPKREGPYEPTTKSLRQHQVPQWFEDAKFGIFIHWGPYAVPAYHEWYVVFMSPKSGFGFNLGGPPYTATQGSLPDKIFKANIREKASGERP